MCHLSGIIRLDEAGRGWATLAVWLPLRLPIGRPVSPRTFRECNRCRAVAERPVRIGPPDGGGDGHVAGSALADPGVAFGLKAAYIGSRPHLGADLEAIGQSAVRRQGSRRGSAARVSTELRRRGRLFQWYADPAHGVDNWLHAGCFHAQAIDPSGFKPN